jgi:hypothetical protein
VKKEKSLFLIAAYSAIFILTDVIFLVANVKGIRKYIYSGITLFEFSFFTAFLFLQIQNKNFKKFILISIAAFFCFLTIYTLFGPFVRIDSIPIGVETILILLFSFYYLYEQVNNPNVMFIYNQYQFWVIVGFMIYLSGSFFVYIFANQIPISEVIKYWFIIDIFLILKNILFSIAIFIFVQETTNKTPQRFPTLKATQ